MCGPATDGWTYQENLLSKYHVKLGHEVTLITSQWIWDEKGKLKFFNRTNYFNQDGVKIIRLPIKKGNVQSRFKRYCNLTETLDAEQPDIIFMHGCQCVNSSEVAKFVKKNHVKLYVDNHADFSNSATNWLSKNILHKIIWRHYAKRLIPYTAKFYGVLPARVEFLTKIYKVPADKCELLVMGADDEQVECARNEQEIKDIRRKYHIVADDFLVMTGGKIDSHKTQTLLLMEAVKNSKNKKIKLIVFGSVEEQLLPKVKELEDGNRVQYIGWIQAQDSYKYFAAADLVVFPGRHSVFWEQVAGQGKPMLVKDWPGTHHVDLGGNVRFLTEDSVEEIQWNIEDLAENPNRFLQMKKTAKEKGMSCFSYEAIAKRCIE